MSHTILVCKKSGETVKPALRASSTSSTTFAKAVRFSENLEQIRHFLQSNCTASINADSSLTNEAQRNTTALLAQSKISPCKYTCWKMTLNNLYEGSRDGQFVRFQSVNLSSDRQSLIGAINVANIAFEKRVSVRFTVDNWQTVSEVTAEYIRPANIEGSYDKFGFTIKLPAQTEAHAMTVTICIRYLVSGQEFWDNNSGKNYFINFIPEMERPVNKQSRPESRLSERYNFADSVHVAATLFVADELARSVAESEQIRMLLGSSPALMHRKRSERDFGSTAYKDMIENLCYFQSSDWPSDISLSRKSANGNSNTVQSSYAIHCF
jgi:hypothetical protein